MNISSDDKELRHSIRLLDSVLTQVLKTQARPEIAATVEQLQHRFAGLLSDGSLLRRQHLLETVEGLDPEAIGEVVRVFNRYFSLLNIAEESHYLRLRRRQAEQGGHYWPGSFHDTLLALKESGVTADKLQVLLDELLYLPVMTAHPSEVKRRTVKSALRNVFLTQEALGDNRMKGYFREGSARTSAMPDSNAVEDRRGAHPEAGRGGRDRCRAVLFFTFPVPGDGAGLPQFRTFSERRVR